MYFIGIDLGTTFVKGAVLDLHTGALSHIRRRPFPDRLPGSPARRFEVDPRAIADAARDLLDELAPAAPNCAGVVLSSQMHSVVLADRAGRPVSNAITWRDTRALEPHPAGGTFFDQLTQRITPVQRQALGNELRPGLPICALFAMAESGDLPRDAVALALPDFVLWQLCGVPPASDPTMAASQGTFDLAAGDWHSDLLERLGLGALSWPRVQPFHQPTGELRVAGRLVPCYPGVGDQQCALAGAALAPGELSLNIATGSQVGLLSEESTPGDYQLRPYFGGRWLRTITHIPAGRALALLVELLTELAGRQGPAAPDPWAYIARTVEATPATDLQLDLAFFASAVGDRGAIANIHEGNLSVGHLFRAAFERMAATYEASARRLAPDADWERVVFSGGLAQGMPVLREVILRRLGAEHRVCATTEDALAGLLALARVCAGLAPAPNNLLSP
jgi:sugar (pentulose or hexulose) kinase